MINFGVTNDPEVIHLGQTLMILSLVLEAARACNAIVIGALNAAGEIKFPVYMGLVSMWGISNPLVYLLGIVCHLGMRGILDNNPDMGNPILRKGVGRMPMDSNSLLNTQRPETETMLKNDNNMDYDMMREYSKQLNGEIEDHDEHRD